MDGGLSYDKTRPGVGSEIKNKAVNSRHYDVKGAPTAVTKSYNGGLTKLLKQVYNTELDK